MVWNVVNSVFGITKLSITNYIKAHLGLKLSLARKDIVAVLNNQDKIQYLAVCNGGGNVSGSSNIIKLNGINKDSNILITLQLNDKNIIKRAKIDFYGNFKVI